MCDLCAFVCPQSVVLEGQYWKRRVEAVAREYRKWRIYHRDKNVSNDIGGWFDQVYRLAEECSLCVSYLCYCRSFSKGENHGWRSCWNEHMG